MPYSPTTWVNDVTKLNAANMNNIEAGIVAAATTAGVDPFIVPTLVTTLPSSPVDGQEIILTDSLSAPTWAWRLKYISAKASNKWVFIGGAPRFSQATAADTQTTTGVFAALTNAPGFVVPVAGIYLVTIAASVLNTNASANDVFIAVGVNTVANTRAVGSTLMATSGIESMQATDLATCVAGDVIKLFSWVTLNGATWGGAGTFRIRSMHVVPTAVGG